MLLFHKTQLFIKSQFNVNVYHVDTSVFFNDQLQVISTSHVIVILLEKVTGQIISIISQSLGIIHQDQVEVLFQLPQVTVELIVGVKSALTIQNKEKNIVNERNNFTIFFQTSDNFIIYI